MDWYTWCVVAWRLSNTLDADFRIDALEEALGKDTPEVFNTGQGRQSTGEASSVSWSSARSELTPNHELINAGLGFIVTASRQE